MHCGEKSVRHQTSSTH